MYKYKYACVYSLPGPVMGDWPMPGDIYICIYI